MELNLCPLQEQQLLLTIESPLQSLVFCFELVRTRVSVHVRVCVHVCACVGTHVGVKGQLAGIPSSSSTVWVPGMKFRLPALTANVKPAEPP